MPAASPSHTSLGRHRSWSRLASDVHRRFGSLWWSTRGQSCRSPRGACRPGHLRAPHQWRSGGLPEVQGPPAPHSHLAALYVDRCVFVRASFGSLRPGMQHRPMQHWAPALSWALGVRGTAQRDVLAQAPHQRIAHGGGLKLLDGGNARIHTEQALLRALGRVSKDLGHGLLARCPEAGAAHHADPDPPNPDDTRQGGYDVGLHRPVGALAVALAQQGAPLLIGAQADYGRGVDGMDRPPLTTDRKSVV